MIRELKEDLEHLESSTHKVESQGVKSGWQYPLISIVGRSLVMGFRIAIDSLEKKKGGLK